MIAISSGANMDFDRLRFVSERADSSETLMSVTIPEQAGSFRLLHSFLHPRNITEFNYRHNGTDKANVIVSFQALAGRTVEEDRAIISTILSAQGFAIQDLSNNEMAKAHTRHMSGGRAVQSFATGLGSPSFSPSTRKSNISDGSSSGSSNNSGNDDKLYEVVYRFEFPEAPGALNKFLDTLSHFNKGWSISLFHYRNRGHDCGRVLVGLLVRGSEKEAFQTFLQQLEYTYCEETENASYELFLK